MNRSPSSSGRGKSIAWWGSPTDTAEGEPTVGLDGSLGLLACLIAGLPAPALHPVPQGQQHPQIVDIQINIVEWRAKYLWVCSTTGAEISALFQ